MGRGASDHPGVSPSLAILVPTYGRAAAVTRLLRALAADASVPVLVSDNASPDGTADVLHALKAELPELDLRVHVQERNVGAEANYAWLVEHAPETDYLWLFGDDDLPDPGAVAEVLDLLARHRPALLHLPHTFESDGRVHATSPCPPAPDVLPSSTALLEGYTRWPSFISSCVVDRRRFARAMRERPTDSPFAPYLWFLLAGRDGPCAVADRILVRGGADATWSDRRAEILTEGTVEIYDAGLHELLDAEAFGRLLDGFFANDDCLDCWQAQPLEPLIEAVRRFPASRQLRRFLWLISRDRSRGDALGVLDAAAHEAGAAAAAAEMVREGEEAFGTGDTGEAVRLFRAAASERPTWPTAWNDLGVVLHAQGRHSAAVEAFDLALELDPGYEDAQVNRAQALAATPRDPSAASGTGLQR